mmetsp:Transcript_27879/g.43268  ORF Transcript_27879/g.43268 Transcript_27879/m.43268 type:complete len:347 (-) Transcript_27879:530-1570(-)|eukprot:CAMPEP_0196803184 /NCGR_PEP_ID=MMETSP1362-20130617/2575_1 /TAXON_ID=163516 /ORGANISM="Leptocylindrus danicus, Strain CCMP1856" /LENGTH=346 /DNA_ID=CAMNT_0042174629 /DNA_START=35 /DNA_END=1075 /DNA_ORIENTATION=-
MRYSATITIILFYSTVISTFLVHHTATAQQQQQQRQLLLGGLRGARKAASMLLHQYCFVNPSQPGPPDNGQQIVYMAPPPGVQQHPHPHPYPYPPPPPYNVQHVPAVPIMQQQQVLQRPALTLQLFSTATIIRFLKITGTSFLISEVLTHLGFFGDEDPFDVNTFAARQTQRIQRFKLHLRGWCKSFHTRYMNRDTMERLWTQLKVNVTRRIPSTYIQPALSSYRGLPNKTKFASGSTIGMFLSRIMVSLSWRAAKVLGLAYIANELLHYLNIIGGEESALSKLWRNAGDVHQESLVSVVDRVRVLTSKGLEYMSNGFQQVLTALVEEETATAVGLAAGIMVGFAI